MARAQRGERRLAPRLRARLREGLTPLVLVVGSAAAGAAPSALVAGWSVTGASAGLPSPSLAVLKGRRRHARKGAGLMGSGAEAASACGKLHAHPRAASAGATRLRAAASRSACSGAVGSIAVTCARARERSLGYAGWGRRERGAACRAGRH